MANNTVYPYGTGGQLPSGIAVVNDLVTGGADKALSAEQGKILNQIKPTIDSEAGADLDIVDENDNALVRFRNGHIKTKNFDSENPITIANNRIKIE